MKVKKNYFLFILQIFVLSLTLLFITGFFNTGFTTYQNDLQNTGRFNGTGFFDTRNIINFTDILNGMDQQPIAGDINNNGKNEIVIFSGNYLKVFDAKLNLIDENFVGPLQGQPTFFDIDADSFLEIIFISNISSTPHFFAYEFDGSNFIQEFNFTIANGGIGSGIKCTNIDTTKVCIFMDNQQFVHIVNLTSRVDSSFNTSVFSDTREKIPAIGDLHNDGGLEAVFWFDENNDNQYGLLVFDLIDRNFDFAFNNSGIVDNIMVPFGVFGTRFVLKGHPVLVDSNNDNKFEVAVSIFYDDNAPLFSVNDRFTELFVFNDTGGLLFRKCEENPSGNCNNGSSIDNFWEGTNPFVLDSNGDGLDDICFIKDKKLFFSFINMTINCFNFSGDILLDSEISPLTQTVATATLADMNNDGKLEIISGNRIYLQNGNSIFAQGFGANFGIPFDVDGNQGLDLLLSKIGKTTIFLDNFGSVEVSNVSISPLIPSTDDDLTCSFVVSGNGTLTANVSWFKNRILQSTETNIPCINEEVCSTATPILSSSTAKNEVWRCSVVGSNASFNSYPHFDEVTILGKTSEWLENCNSKNNLCRQSGQGLFQNPNVSRTLISDGMNFEPIIDDINNDGQNEIVIFSNSKLKILNQNLGLVDEIDVGNLVGQPTIFNIDFDSNLEIIFVANISSVSHLLAYEFDTGFTNQCNVTISNGASGSGIKCVDIGAEKSCFFKDQKNVFYNFDMSSCTQTANLTTNNQEDTTPTVPSILDYDNDGNLEGIWWFNNDGDQFIGIAVIELESMTFDTGFNGIGFIDDITQGSGSDYRAGFENLKGNPVFYSQEGAGSNEILVAYDNEKIAGFFGDEFQCFRSVLKVFDTDGTLLWTNRPTTCELPSTGIFNCDMSTPVVVDADRDGIDDVCFILKGASPCFTGAVDDFFFCLDRAGNNLEGYPKSTSDVKLFGSASASLDTNMYIADMDSDGEEEMVGAGFIWNLNGTILKGNYSSFTSAAPIPVDVDNDGVLDLLGTKAGETDIFKSAPVIELEIVDIIPVQTVENVNMTKGKTGLVRIIVRNNGLTNSTAKVNVTFEGNLLSTFNDLDTKTIITNSNASFDFNFTPTQTGTQTFIVEVEEN